MFPLLKKESSVMEGKSKLDHSWRLEVRWFGYHGQASNCNQGVAEQLWNSIFWSLLKVLNCLRRQKSSTIAGLFCVTWASLT